MNESARSSRSRVRIASDRRRSTTAWSVIVSIVVALLTATAVGTAAGSTDALIVTGNGSLDAGEQVLQSRLAAAGYTGYGLSLRREHRSELSQTAAA